MGDMIRVGRRARLSVEGKTETLEFQNRIKTEKLQNSVVPNTRFIETFRTAMEFLANPYKQWISDAFEDKRMVLRLAFSGKVRFAQNEGLSNRYNHPTFQGVWEYPHG